MKRILPLFLVLAGASIILTSPKPAFAQQAPDMAIDPGAGDLLNKSEFTYSSVESFSVRFEAVNTVDGAETKSSGKISFSRPDKARFEITSEAGNSTVVTDGEKVAEQLPAAPRVYKPIALAGKPVFDVVNSRTSATLNFPLLSLLKGTRYMELGYKWQSATTLPEGGVKLEGTTVEGAPIVMQLHFDPASHMISAAEIATSVQGKVVTSAITFYDPQSNPDFGDGAFALAAPLAPAVNPDTNELLVKAINAYKALPSFSTHFETVQASDGNSSTTSGDLTVSGTDKARLQMKTKDGEVTSVTDGQKVWVQNSPTFYMEKDAKAVGGAMAALSSLQTATNAPVPDIIMGQGVSKLPIRFDHVEPVGENGVKFGGSKGSATFEFTMNLDPATNLMTSFVTDVTAGDKHLTYTTTFSDVKPRAELTPATFTFTPPAGAQQLDQQPTWDPKLVVGFTPYGLASKDATGKTHTWDEYKGKVVLLDFWATWCGPCIGELPNVLKNYATYKPQGFDVIGVSLDEDKKAWTDFIAKRNMNYLNLFDGQGWKNVDATTYKIQAIPFSLLIGKDGKIAAVNPRGAALEPAIKAALAK